jgi:hypothetical protein
MWDNLTTLLPTTVKEAQTVLFLHKLPRHIRNLINPWAFKEPEDLIQRCNEIWKCPEHGRGCRSRGRSEAALSFPRGPPLPLSVSRERVRQRQSLAAAARQPRDRPEAAAMIACVSTTPA